MQNWEAGEQTLPVETKAKKALIGSAFAVSFSMRLSWQLLENPSHTVLHVSLSCILSCHFKMLWTLWDVEVLFFSQGNPWCSISFIYFILLNCICLENSSHTHKVCLINANNSGNFLVFHTCKSPKFWLDWKKKHWSGNFLQENINETEKRLKKIEYHCMLYWYFSRQYFQLSTGKMSCYFCSNMFFCFPFCIQKFLQTSSCLK